jgi:hypothetical protein
MTINSHNVSRIDNKGISVPDDINKYLNELNKKLREEAGDELGKTIDIYFQVAVTEPVFISTRKILSSKNHMDVEDFLYNEDVFESIGLVNVQARVEHVKQFIIRVYFYDISGNGKDDETHCFYKALSVSNVFHQSVYKTYTNFIESFPSDLPQDGSVSISHIPFIEKTLGVCISVDGDKAYESKFTNKYNQHIYLTFKDNHYEVKRVPSKQKGTRKIIKFSKDQERGLVIVHDDNEYLYSFDGENHEKSEIVFDEKGKKVKGKYKDKITEQLKSVNKMYELDKTLPIEQQMEKAFEVINKDYRELSEITDGEFNVFQFMNASSMVKHIVYRYAGKTHINDITEPVQMYEFDIIEKAKKGGFVDILSKETTFEKGYSYDMVSVSSCSQFERFLYPSQARDNEVP